MIRVTVAQLGIDRNTNSPVVILQEVDGERSLPIWIGASEAQAIAMALQGVKPQRPMTHDLLKDLLLGLGGELRRVQIISLRDDTYFAELQLAQHGEIVQVDARPSDSIALALRCSAPIYTTDELLDRGPPSGETPPRDGHPDAAEALRRYLEQLDPQDFGRFQP